jgi:hypothetical protein
MSDMTTERALWISAHRLPGEPEPEPMGPPEPMRPKPPRRLDTGWARYIETELRRERAVLTEAVGAAIGEIRNEILAETDEQQEQLSLAGESVAALVRVVEQLFTQVEGLRGTIGELRAGAARDREEATAQAAASDQTRSEVARLLTENLTARRRTRKPKAKAAPIPNGNGDGDGASPQ